MRYVVVGIAMTAMAAALGFYAASEDSYYGDGTTHWEHATRDGHTGFLVTLFAVLATSSLVVVLLGLSYKRGRWELLAIPAIALFLPLLLFTYAVLSLGH
jgi:O-antigen/teichoic acid export membrane protein